MTAVAGKHTNIAWERLRPVVLAEAISSVDRRGLPRPSPALAGSALGAPLGGGASVDDAAAAAVIGP